MNVAVFLPNWLGDLVMATPTLRALRRHFGSEVRIVGILRPYLADVLNGTAWLDELWFFDPRHDSPELRSWAIAKRMRTLGVDLALLLSNSFRTAWVAWLGGAKERVGYVRYARTLLLTAKLYPPRVGRRFIPTPMVESYLALAKLIGCPEESLRLELAVTPAEEDSGRAVFERLGLAEDARPVALNCSGAYGAAKLWPREYFARLAQRICDELHEPVLVFCGPREKDAAREIVRLADRSQVYSMAEQPMDLGTAKACLRRCRLMVSTDSGPRHMAAALGVPVVTLFGPISPVWSANPTQKAINLLLDLECIGCGKRVCPQRHHRCMRELSVERVFAAVKELEKESLAQVPAPPHE